jgi:hypothetical protein
MPQAVSRAGAGQRNVATPERWISGFAGAGLLASALLRPSPRTALLGLAGLALIERSVTGWCSIYALLGIGRDAEHVVGPVEGEPGSAGIGNRAHQDMAIHDKIEVASEDSFPASDPPSWTGSTVNGTIIGTS